MRVLDTRTTTGGHHGKVAGGSSLTLTVGGTNGVPANAAVAVLNIATTDTTSPGYLTAYADGASRPITSNSNWPSGRTVSNLALVPMTDGKVVLYNGGKGSVKFVADLVGYYNPLGSAAMYLPSQPTRLLDTRTGTGTGGQIAKLPPAARSNSRSPGAAACSHKVRALLH